MASEQPSRDAFMTAIEAKIAAWTAVLNSYRAAVSLDGPLGETTGGQHTPARHGHAESVRPMDLPVGVFRDKSLREAIEIFLGAARRKQTNKEIAIGLQKGGIATTSTNFEATVATALGRMKDDGTVLRFPDGWDLAASYPDRLRSRLEKDAKPKRTRKSKKTKNSTGEKWKTIRAKVSTVNADKPVGATLDARILGFLEATAPHAYLLKEVGDTVQEFNLNRLALAFARLTRHGKVIKNDDGRYSAPPPSE